MVNQVDKLFQSFHSASFSPCGKYLASSNREGVVFIHKLANLVKQTNPGDDDSVENVMKLRPLVTVKDPNVNSTVQLLPWKEYLLCCYPSGQVNAYLWSDLSKQRTGAAWKQRFTDSQKLHSGDGYEYEIWVTLTDTNGRELLMAGSSASKSDQTECPILCWEFETGSLLNTFNGHTNSVYCISPLNSSSESSVQEFLSAGEDGEVRLWDMRSPRNSAAVLKPCDGDCARPSLGKWIGCLLTDGEWMICGGGPQLSLWHIGSRSLVKPMTANGSDVTEHRCGVIVDDKIVTGGSGANIFHWNYRGESVSVMPTSSNFLYDLQRNKAPNQNLIAAIGSGPLIDLYSNLIYKMTPIDTIF